VIFSVRHRVGCPAVEVEPDACACEPTIYLSIGEQDVQPTGTLRRGWTRADFARAILG
jgi:hypothetical protein